MQDFRVDFKHRLWKRRPPIGVGFTTAASILLDLVQIPKPCLMTTKRSAEIVQLCLSACHRQFCHLIAFLRKK